VQKKAGDALLDIARIDFTLKRRELVDIDEHQRNISNVHFTTIV
jgi:hypothetical protein